MILKYGTYPHEDNEVEVAMSRQGVLNDAGIVSKYMLRWDIAGQINAADEAALTVALAALEVAYGSHGKDLILYDNSSNVTAHAIYSSQTLGGTRVIGGVSYPVGSGAQYSTFRNYTITVEAEIPSNILGGEILSYQETLSFTGTGGPRYVTIELRNGEPQRQRVSERTACRALQSGQIIGLTRRQPRPPPLWPQYLDAPDVRVDFGSPKTMGRGTSKTETDFLTSWSYSFTSPTPLVGNPTPRPVG